MEERENTADKTSGDIPAEFTETDEESLGNQFMEILTEGNIRTVFQPIISLRDCSVLGYEALSRGPQRQCSKAPKRYLIWPESTASFGSLNSYAD